MDESEAAATFNEGHYLLRQPHTSGQGNNSDASGESLDESLSLGNVSSLEDGTGVPRSIALRLYISHFLSTWNSRLFEFGAALFLTSVFPGTLLPVSIYSLVRNAGYIVFAQPLGAWINNGNRLNIIRTSIVGQRVPVAVSCALFLILEVKGSTWGFRKDNIIFAVLVFLAVVEKLCSTMNMISVERDWVRTPRRLYMWCVDTAINHMLTLSQVVVITDGKEAIRRGKYPCRFEPDGRAFGQLLIQAQI